MSDSGIEAGKNTPIVSPKLDETTLVTDTTKVVTALNKFLPKAVRATIYSVGGVATAVLPPIGDVVGGTVGLYLAIAGAVCGAIVGSVAVSHVS